MGTQTCPQTRPADVQTRDFYIHSLDILDKVQVPFVVGGGYALHFFTGIHRQTKDLDVFIRQSDRDRALAAFAQAGYRIEITWPHFLAKAQTDYAFIDLIYNSGNGLSPVDDAWFQYGVAGILFGRSVLYCPVEEIIWTKAFVQDRDRFDGADVNHLLLARGPQLDWRRMLRRFETYPGVLLAQLLLFSYSFPSERWRIPLWVMDALWQAVHQQPQISEPICRGTFLAQRAYLPDVEQRGYIDARLQPLGPLTPEDISLLGR